jgi:hypothetical protein
VLDWYTLLLLLLLLLLLPPPPLALALLLLLSVCVICDRLSLKFESEISTTFSRILNLS